MPIFTYLRLRRKSGTVSYEVEGMVLMSWDKHRCRKTWQTETAWKHEAFAA